MESDGDPESGYRVLIVDDDEEVAATISLYLEDDTENLDTTIVTSAADALDRLEAGDIDCVISDYKMPDTNGVELLREIREDHPNVPFLIFTARGSELVASKAISAGATDYLPKGSPEKYDLLANRALNAIEQAESRVELERAKARFEAVTANTDLGVLTVDESGVVEYANPGIEGVLGYAPDDLRGQPVSALLADADGFDVPEDLNPSGDATLLDVVRADGTETTVNVAFNEYVTASGERLFTGVVRDSE